MKRLMKKGRKSMKIGSLKSKVHGSPYREHTGKFKVNIGNGSDKDKYDWVYIEQDSDGSGVVLVKHDCCCICFDSKRFKQKDFSHPLNMKVLKTSDEAYEKLMKWIGKMVKKDERGRYFTDTRYKEYTYNETQFDSNRLGEIAEKI